MGILLGLCVFMPAPAAQDPSIQGRTWTADLAAIRQLATLVPGPYPLRVNVVKFAESRRTRNFSVKGAPREPSVQARTAFQVVYPNSRAVMIDSGMDLQTHRFFGRGVEEPYFPDVARAVERAVSAASAVIMTHEHGDHVAGVIRTPAFAQLAPKTVLTRAQVNTLLTNPQMPEIRLTPELAARFVVVDYDSYYPFAPGMVLIKAPGHTAGSQMIYVVLASGKEFVFAGDVAWHMDGVRTITGKDAPWIVEETAPVMAELTWLKLLVGTEKNVTVVLSHDDEQRQALVAQKILGDRLE